MSGERDIEHILDDWMTEGPTNAPDRILDHLESRIRRQSQHPAWRGRLSGPGRYRDLRLLAAAVAAVIVIAVAGILIWQSRGQAVVGSTQPPASVAPTSSPVNLTGPTPVALPSPRSVQASASISVGVSTGAGGLIASDGTTIWVSTDTSIVGIDPSTNLVTTRIGVPRTAYSSAIAATKGAIWLDAPDANPLTLDRYDSATGRLVASVPVPEVLSPVAVGGAIWVDQQSGGATFRLDPATNKVVATIGVGASGADGLGALASGAGAIWVVDTDASSIVEISPVTNKVVRTIPTGGTFSWASAAMTVGSGAIWGTADGSLTKIDPVTGATSWTAGFDGSLRTALVHADAIWVGLDLHTAANAGTELALDPGSGTAVDALSIPDGQVTDAFEAFGSVWLVLGQQGLVERYSQDVLTVRQ